MSGRIRNWVPEIIYRFVSSQGYGGHNCFGYLVLKMLINRSTELESSQFG